MDKKYLQNLIKELREEVQILNSKIDALEAELRCSEDVETPVEQYDPIEKEIEEMELDPELEAELDAWFEENQWWDEPKSTNAATIVASPITINIGNLSMGNLPIDYATPIAHKRQIKPLEGSDKLGSRKTPQMAQNAAFKRFIKNKLRRS